MSEPMHRFPLSDPLIDEVRARRRELLQSYGNDLDKLFKAIRQLEAQHPEKVVDRRRTPRPPTPHEA